MAKDSIPRPQPVAIIAELGANHGQDFNKAKEMIRRAWAAGADSVKVQLFTPEQMTLKRYTDPFRIKEGPWAGRTLYELYQQARMPHEWVPELKGLAEELGMGFIASVYHPDMIPIAESYEIKVYKVASFEVNYTDLLDELAKLNKPVIVSTGAATEKDLDEVAKRIPRERLAFLKCTSQYPAPLEKMNLATIPELARRYGVPIGLSDHSRGPLCATVAVALGASMIEKHFKIDNEGLDAEFSANEKEFNILVSWIRVAEQALGVPNFTPTTTQYKRRLVEGRMVRTVT